MEFIGREEPYSGFVIRAEENGKWYRVAPKFPWEPEGIALCELAPGTGWAPVRDLTEEEKRQYFAFKESFEKK